MAGLDENGLTIKRFSELNDEIYQEEQERISPDVVNDDDTVFGQFNNIMSSSFSDLWALAQAVNDNFNLDKAEGRNLDDLVALRGISRLAATKTSGIVNFTGSAGASVTAGSIFENPVTKDRFTNTSTVEISLTSCITADYTVKTLLNNENYTITVNDVPYSYISDADATETEIVNGIKALIDADVSATWSASVVSDVLTISSDDNLPLELFSVTFISADSVTSQGTVTAEEDGDIVAPATSVNSIVTPINGLVSIVNPDQLTRGRSRETDEELRLRVGTTTSTTGKATPSAIIANLLAVSGVSGAAIEENTSMVVDGDGRPPKSFETVVVGGDNADIANTIYENKPAGIETHGTITEFVNDVNGSLYAIKFSRPLAKTIAVQVTYTLYSEEEFPVDGETRMADAILTHVNDLGLDVDVITGRMYGPVYASAAGLQNLTIEVQELANAGDTPNPANWSEATIPVSAAEFASTTLADIYVVAN